jgi:hypothetical protein
MHPSLLPVVQHRHFRSRDADETRVFLASQQFQFDVAGRQARSVDTRLDGFSLPGMYLGRLQYGARAEIRTATRMTTASSRYGEDISRP